MNEQILELLTSDDINNWKLAAQLIKGQNLDVTDTSKLADMFMLYLKNAITNTEYITKLKHQTSQFKTVGVLVIIKYSNGNFYKNIDMLPDNYRISFNGIDNELNLTERDLDTKIKRLILENVFN